MSQDSTCPVREKFAQDLLGTIIEGDQVEKITGYRISGEVRSVFSMRDGSIRYAVEIQAQGGGSFIHIYNGTQLRKL